MDLINTYGPAIISFLVGEITPTEICVDLLKLCTMAPAVADHKLPALTAAFDDTACKVCTDIFQEFDTILTDPTDQGDILEPLEALCSSLGPLEGPCKDFIAAEGGKLLDFVAGKVTPTEVCNNIAKVCP